MSIGERIKLARKMKQLSQEDLAQSANVSKMAISKYEHDQDLPSSGVMINISMALGVPVEFFFRPPIVIVKLQAYRKLSSLGQKEQDAIQAQIQEWLERYIELEDLFPEEKNVSIKLPHYVINSFAEIENAAHNLRLEWELGLDAIENLMELLEDQHIKVGLIDAFQNFDACTFFAGDAPVIVSKAGLPGDRQRFNLAHELGHLVMEIAEGLDEEKAAHRFASAFLVPDRTAIFELGKRRSKLDFNELYLLKRKYGLSMQAWIYRSKDLGIISEATADHLFRTFSQKGWKKKEPGEALPSEIPLRLQRLVYRAYAEDLISQTRSEEFLGERLDPVWFEKALSHDIAAPSANH
ncbi:MAG: XRE family transcriptional regulator [Anaerolineae bacterium]|nr:XRE family transcriptional regulator [Anaerolineae bacterium]